MKSWEYSSTVCPPKTFIHLYRTGCYMYLAVIGTAVCFYEIIFGLFWRLFRVFLDVGDRVWWQLCNRVLCIAVERVSVALWCWINFSVQIWWTLIWSFVDQFLFCLYILDVNFGGNFTGIPLSHFWQWTELWALCVSVKNFSASSFTFHLLCGHHLIAWDALVCHLLNVSNKSSIVHLFTITDV